MTEIIEVKNMEYVGEQMYPVGGEQMKLQTMVLKELDAVRWNTLAERENTKSFIRMNGKHPSSYTEVKEWVFGLIKGTEKAPAVTGAGSVNAFA